MAVDQFLDCFGRELRMMMSRRRHFGRPPFDDIVLSEILRDATTIQQPYRQVNNVILVINGGSGLLAKLCGHLLCAHCVLGPYCFALVANFVLCTYVNFKSRMRKNSLCGLFLAFDALNRRVQLIQTASNASKPCSIRSF